MSFEFTIAICDDSEDTIILIENLIKEYGKQNGLAINFLKYTSGQEVVNSFYSFDILLLDIDMPELNGIETAERLNSQRDFSTYRIIMLSALSGEWIKEAYRTKAIRYVSKPIEKNELFDALRAAFSELDRGIEIRVISDNFKYNIFSSDILYAKASGDYCLIHTKSGIYNKSCSLVELKKIIGTDKFFITHKSYLVNLSQVKKITDKCVEMKNGECIPYSRRRKKDLSKAFVNSRF